MPAEWGEVTGDRASIFSVMPNVAPDTHPFLNGRRCTVSIVIVFLCGYINNLRYADNTTQMAESEEDLKNLLLRVKEESKNVA